MTTISNITPAPIEPQVPAFKGNTEQQEAPKQKSSISTTGSALIGAGIVGLATFGLYKTGHLGKIFGKTKEAAEKLTKEATDVAGKATTEATGKVTTEAAAAAVAKAPEAIAPVAKVVEKLTPELAAQKLFKENLDFLVYADEKNVQKAVVITKNGKNVETKLYKAIRNNEGEIVGAENKFGNTTTTFINGKPKKEVTKTATSKTTKINGETTTKSYDAATKTLTLEKPDGSKIITKKLPKGHETTTINPLKDEKTGKVYGSTTTVETKEKIKNGSKVTVAETVKKGKKISTNSKTVETTTNKAGVVSEITTDNVKGTKIFKKDGAVEAIELSASKKINVSKEGVLTYTDGASTRFFKKDGDTVTEFANKKCEAKDTVKTLYSAENEKTGKVEYFEKAVRKNAPEADLTGDSLDIFKTVTTAI